MNILITNDDGYLAKGLLELVDALKDIANIVVVAPSSERSGSSVSLTIHKPLRYYAVPNDLGIPTYAVDGSPVDSVKLALAQIIDHDIDLVISGINKGGNLGMNSIYSGTIGAALEATVWGIKSIALSLNGYADLKYETTKKFIRDYIKNIDLSIISKGSMLNINVPNCDEDKIQGYKYTSVSSFSYLDSYEKRLDTFGDKYFWLSDFDKHPTDIEEDSDILAVRDNYISISPLRANMTDNTMLNNLK